MIEALIRDPAAPIALLRPGPPCQHQTPRVCLLLEIRKAGSQRFKTLNTMRITACGCSLSLAQCYLYPQLLRVCPAASHLRIPLPGTLCQLIAEFDGCSLTT